MKSFGRTQLRVVLALVLTGVVPLMSAMVLADVIFSRVSSTAFQPEFGDHLDRSLGLYADLVRSMKRAMRNEGALMAADPELRQAVEQGDERAVAGELDEALAGHPTVSSLAVEDETGALLAERERDRPLDPERERAFTVRKPLTDRPQGPALVAVFGADRTRMAEMEEAQQFVQGWKAFAESHRDQWIVKPYLAAFAVLFGLTVVLAVITGVLVVRPPIRRINQLAAATRPVAEGDLSVRVDDRGRDEIAALARAFNQMLENLGQSRARIEFLRRIGEWQTMARRLAHEIKNPLTPIQLAVEECHGRYRGDDPGYQRLLDTTLDIVVEEVASLRRLVSEFAAFARLPQAELREGDLAGFLDEQRARLGREVDEAVTLEVAIAEGPVEVAFDRTLLYRVLSNLVGNAVQAGGSTVRLSMRAERSRVIIDVDDDGSGIDHELQPSIFEPYVTTKKEGTGLGLAIVKKIVIDHGGSVEVGDAPLGGARFRIELPVAGSRASLAALGHQGEPRAALGPASG